jgi:hypothetical protein
MKSSLRLPPAHTRREHPEQLFSGKLLDLPVYSPSLRDHYLTLHMVKEGFQRSRR